MTQVVLASASPRRQALLAQMGLRFEVCPSDADETLDDGMTPAEAAMVLARRKAAVVAAQYPEALVIAADTLVAADGALLGKPADVEEAAAMLRCLSGREHQVVTGLCVVYHGEERVACESTAVCFVELSDADIARYVRTGEPLDKAGAYGIQGRAGVFVSSIRGCYYNVMGLPLVRLRAMLCDLLGLRGYDALIRWEEGETV
jgi:septum formation protein